MYKRMLVGTEKKKRLQKMIRVTSSADDARKLSASVSGLASGFFWSACLVATA